MKHKVLLSLAERGAWYTWLSALEAAHDALSRNKLEEYETWTRISDRAHGQMMEIREMLKAEIREMLKAEIESA